jgi:hypothetical protein
LQELANRHSPSLTLVEVPAFPPILPLSHPNHLRLLTRFPEHFPNRVYYYYTTFGSNKLLLLTPPNKTGHTTHKALYISTNRNTNIIILRNIFIDTHLHKLNFVPFQRDQVYTLFSFDYAKPYPDLIFKLAGDFHFNLLPFHFLFLLCYVVEGIAYTKRKYVSEQEEFVQRRILHILGRGVESR